jgi:predicted DNA-binding transcriptional regulator YafY
VRKADRLFQLVNLVRAHQPVTAQRLARELDVSVRSIYRYIDDLSVSGIPVYGEAGVGYRLDQHFELPPLNLNPDEVEALMLGMEMIGMTTGRKLPAAARSLQSKIAAALPEAQRGNNTRRAWALTLAPQPERTDLWDRISDSIAHRQEITLHYHSLDNRFSERTVYPLGLFYWSGKWTLASWCTLRSDFRDFRLDRIEQLTVSPRIFADTPELSIQTYLHIQEQRCGDNGAATDSTLSVACP